MLYNIAQQALPLRWNWSSEHGVEEISNLHQLLLLRTDDDPRIFNWLTQKIKYTSPETENEMPQNIISSNFKNFLIFFFAIRITTIWKVHQSKLLFKSSFAVVKNISGI